MPGARMGAASGAAKAAVFMEQYDSLFTLVFSVVSDVGREQRALRNRQSPTAELEKITEDLRRRAKDKHHKSPNAK